MKGRRLQVAIAPYDRAALFRWSVLCKVRAREKLGVDRSEAVEATAQELHYDGDGIARRVSERTLYRWLAEGEGQGPLVERPVVPSLVLPAVLLAYLKREKLADVGASVPELLRRATEVGLIKPDGPAVDRVTAYRALQRMGVSLARRRTARLRDSRRFAYGHRMQMVLCDGKHFRAGATRAKRVVLFFLDDATRDVLRLVVGPSESTELFLLGVFRVICRWGFPGVFYLDHGPGFISDDTLAVLRALGITFIHGETAYPAGHGAIEAFNKTAKKDVLRLLAGRPDVDPDYAALELRLSHYAEQQYNVRPHESLDGDTPFARFHADEAPLRFPESEDALRQKFVLHEERSVSNDHVVSVDSVAYETPRGTAGTVVCIQRRLLDGTVFLLHHGRYIELKPVDLVANAHTPRARTQGSGEEEAQPLVKSAADLAFDRDFRPVVGPDGGYPNKCAPAQ